MKSLFFVSNHLFWSWLWNTPLFSLSRVECSDKYSEWRKRTWKHVHISTSHKTVIIQNSVTQFNHFSLLNWLYIFFGSWSRPNLKVWNEQWICLFSLYSAPVIAKMYVHNLPSTIIVSIITVTSRSNQLCWWDSRKMTCSHVFCMTKSLKKYMNGTWMEPVVLMRCYKRRNNSSASNNKNVICQFVLVPQWTLVNPLRFHHSSEISMKGILELYL